MAWHGDELLDKLHKQMGARLYRAASFLETEIKKTLGVVVDKSGGRSAGGKFTKHQVVGRSAPGEPPRLETGELRRSVTKEVDAAAMQARVGTNKNYSGYLERGTSKMKARPFLKPILEANRGVIAHILAGQKLD